MRGMNDEQAVYRIEHFEPHPRQPFGEVIYRIFADDRLVARVTHDWRGEDVEIDLLPHNGEIGRQFDNASELIIGGGPEPLSLTPEAIAYLKKHRARGRA